MARIKVEDLFLDYPMLGGGSRRRVTGQKVVAAGKVIKDKSERSRSISALRDVNFELRDGDRVGLIGNNGAGKSTLLRVLAGIYPPIRGKVSVSGRVASLFSIGLGMQNEVSGYRNIELSGLVAGYSKKEVNARLPEIAEFSELGEYLNLPVRTYSNGMAMRLKFACATAFEPEILLMDEWLGAGDPEFQKKANQRMRELVDKAGILVLASHNHHQIAKECNMAIWMEQGQMRCIGPVQFVLAEAEAGKVRLQNAPKAS